MSDNKTKHISCPKSVKVELVVTPNAHCIIHNRSYMMCVICGKTFSKDFTQKDAEEHFKSHVKEEIINKLVNNSIYFDNTKILLEK